MMTDDECEQFGWELRALFKACLPQPLILDITKVIIEPLWDGKAPDSDEMQKLIDRMED